MKSPDDPSPRGTSPCLTAFLTGTIAPGDFDKVRNFYKRNYRTLTTMFVASGGGDVGEAIQIGRLIRKYLTTVYAPEKPDTLGIFKGLCAGSNCVCASACALIWFGATERMGTIGLHRPRIDDPSFAARPAEAASRAYRQALSDMETYLHEMEVPESIVETIMSTPASEIFWKTVPFMGLPDRPASLAEWIDAACGQESRANDEMWRNLDARNVFGPPLTLNEQAQLASLGKERVNHSKCEEYLKARTVSTLPPP